MNTANHEEFHIIEATILEDAKKNSSDERKIWIKYRKNQEGAPSFTKIFRFTKPQIVPSPEGAGHVFKEIALFKQKVVAGEIGFTLSSKPPIEPASIKSMADKKRLEQEYFTSHTPEKIFLPPNFPHKSE